MAIFLAIPIILLLSLSLSLSLSLICANRQSTTYINIRARARKYTAFHAFCNGKPLCFYAMPLAKATFSATQIQLRK